MLKREKKVILLYIVRNIFNYYYKLDNDVKKSDFLIKIICVVILIVVKRKCWMFF